MNVRKIISTLLTIVALSTTSVLAGDGTLALTVEVFGATPGEGQIVFTLFDSKQTFLKQPFATRSVPVNGEGRAFSRFKGLDVGTYALSVYHDADANGELNTNLFGIPTELVGFSNQARGLLGPPSFEKASFPLSENHSLEIRLGKAKD